MEYHRFSLQKYRTGIKIACPECGRKACFTRYVDNEGKVDFPDYVGRCDHENSCGYNFTPSMYFDKNPQSRPAQSEPKRIPDPPKPPSFIDRNVMESTLKGYDINPLFAFIERSFGREEAERLFKLYNVGTSKMWGGSAVFWQVDCAGRVRSGKIMSYNPKTGHRVKAPQAHVAWAHSAMKLSDFNLCQCYFGEHLLAARPYDKVIIVESEKTSIIGAHFLPEYVWLATGGISNLRPSEALRNRDITLIPDLRAEDKWSAKLPGLQAVCRSVVLSDVISSKATPDQVEAGWDIADFLLQEMTPQMVLAHMIEQNPVIGKMVKDLDLHIVGFVEDEPGRLQQNNRLGGA